MVATEFRGTAAERAMLPARHLVESPQRSPRQTDLELCNDSVWLSGTPRNSCPDVVVRELRTRCVELENEGFELREQLVRFELGEQERTLQLEAECELREAETAKLRELLASLAKEQERERAWHAVEMAKARQELSMLREANAKDADATSARTFHLQATKAACAGTSEYYDLCDKYFLLWRGLCFKDQSHSAEKASPELVQIVGQVHDSSASGESGQQMTCEKEVLENSRMLCRPFSFSKLETCSITVELPSANLSLQAEVGEIQQPRIFAQESTQKHSERSCSPLIGDEDCVPIFGADTSRERVTKDFEDGDFVMARFGAGKTLRGNSFEETWLGGQIDASSISNGGDSSASVSYTIAWDDGSKSHSVYRQGLVWNTSIPGNVIFEIVKRPHAPEPTAVPSCTMAAATITINSDVSKHTTVPKACDQHPETMTGVPTWTVPPTLDTEARANVMWSLEEDETGRYEHHPIDDVADKEGNGRDRATEEVVSGAAVEHEHDAKENDAQQLDCYEVTPKVSPIVKPNIVYEPNTSDASNIEDKQFAPGKLQSIVESEEDDRQDAVQEEESVSDSSRQQGASDLLHSEGALGVSDSRPSWLDWCTAVLKDGPETKSSRLSVEDNSSNFQLANEMRVKIETQESNSACLESSKLDVDAAEAVEPEEGTEPEKYGKPADIEVLTHAKEKSASKHDVHEGESEFVEDIEDAGDEIESGEDLQEVECGFLEGEEKIYDDESGDEDEEIKSVTGILTNREANCAHGLPWQRVAHKFDNAVVSELTWTGPRAEDVLAESDAEMRSDGNTRPDLRTESIEDNLFASTSTAIDEVEVLDHDTDVSHRTTVPDNDDDCGSDEIDPAMHVDQPIGLLTSRQQGQHTSLHPCWPDGLQNIHKLLQVERLRHEQMQTKLNGYSTPPLSQASQAARAMQSQTLQSEDRRQDSVQESPLRSQRDHEISKGQYRQQDCVQQSPIQSQRGQATAPTQCASFSQRTATPQPGGRPHEVATPLRLRTVEQAVQLPPQARKAVPAMAAVGAPLPHAQPAIPRAPPKLGARTVEQHVVRRLSVDSARCAIASAPTLLAAQATLYGQAVAPAWCSRASSTPCTVPVRPVATPGPLPTAPRYL